MQNQNRATNAKRPRRQWRPEPSHVFFCRTEVGGCGRPVLFLREDKPIVAFGVLRKTIRQTGLAVHKGEEAGRAVIAPRNMWRANELRRKLEESCKGKRERGE